MNFLHFIVYNNNIFITFATLFVEQAVLTFPSQVKKDE